MVAQTALLQILDIVTESIRETLPVLKRTLEELDLMRSRFSSDEAEGGGCGGRQIDETQIALRTGVDGQEEVIEVCCIGELGRPFRDGYGNNDYSIFSFLGDKFGVYVFVHETDGVLYVGEAHKQKLKRRIEQNYSNNDGGGTFRKNWCGEGTETPRSMDDYREMLTRCRIVTVSAQTEGAVWIKILERILLFVFDPPYNKDK